MGELITGQVATYVEEMHINTPKRYEICCITASCFVKVLEYCIHHDVMNWLEKVAPNNWTFSWPVLYFQIYQHLINSTDSQSLSDETLSLQIH